MSEYGMLAKDDIEEGEVLFTIPRSALLHQGTTKVAALLEKGNFFFIHKKKNSKIFNSCLTVLFSFFSKQRSQLFRTPQAGFLCCWLCFMSTLPQSPTGGRICLCGQILRHWIIPYSGNKTKKLDYTLFKKMYQHFKSHYDFYSVFVS